MANGRAGNPAKSRALSPAALPGGAGIFLKYKINVKHRAADAGLTGADFKQGSRADERAINFVAWVGIASDPSSH
jgi:hypothetical protein